MAGANYKIQTGRFEVGEFSLFKNAKSRDVEGCFPLRLPLLLFFYLPVSLHLFSFLLI